MKHIILAFSFVLSCVSTPFSQDMLNNIEQRIINAYGKSLQSNTDEHQVIIDELETAQLEASKAIITYWVAFASYRSALFHMNQSERDKAQVILEKGMAQLKALASPSSEHLALHGSMLSLYISFQPGMAAKLSSQANKLYKAAIKSNDQNLRAYLGIGRSDYFTPKKYGGGLKAESYLKQALNKPDASGDEDYTPTWGKDDAYYYLASFYHREGRMEEAKLYCQKGLKLFPQHYLLNSLKNKVL